MTYVAEKPGPKRHLVMGTSPGNIKVEEKEVPKIIRAIEAAGKNVDHISMAKRFYTKTLAARKEISKLKEKGYRIFRESGNGRVLVVFEGKKWDKLQEEFENISELISKANKVKPRKGNAEGKIAEAIEKLEEISNTSGDFQEMLKFVVEFFGEKYPIEVAYWLRDYCEANLR